MSKSIVLVLWLAVVCAMDAAAQESGPVYSVRDYGAMGNGTTLDTAALQACIDACHANGGGTVEFPAGRYLSGTLFLKDNVRLHLSMGATLLGSADLSDYPTITCNYPSRSDTYTVRALLWGEGLHNVAISGDGVIDGQGALFRGKEASEEEMAEVTGIYREQGRHVPDKVYFNRPYVLRLISCRKVVVEGVTLRDSPMWMQHYLACEDVTIRGIHVFNHVAANNDMIDIDGCRNVTIADCYGDTDDDALTLKSTGASPTENVVIMNCILSSHCNALKAGTESAGGFNDITVTNCVIRKSSVPKAMSGRSEGLAGIALEIVDGGRLERVSISNLTIQDTTAPIFLRLGDRGRAAKLQAPRPAPGVFRDVSISNIVATGAGGTGCVISGIPGHYIENVRLSNVSMSFAGGGTREQALADVPEHESKYPESTMFGTLPAFGLYVRHVQGLVLDNVRLACVEPDARPALATDDVHDMRIDNLSVRGETIATTNLALKGTTGVFITGSQAFKADAYLTIDAQCRDIVLSGNALDRVSTIVDGDASIVHVR